MEIYIIILVLSILMTISAKKRTQTLFSFSIMLMMLLVCGLRAEEIGVDTSRYISRFYEGIEKVITAEKLFYSSYVFVRSYTSSEQVWLFAVSAIIYLPLFYILKKNSPLPVLSMLIYMVSVSLFFPESMNIIRHSIASSFLLFAYVSYNKSKNIFSIPTVSLITIASLFHLSSLFSIPYFFLKRVKFSPLFVKSSLVLATVFGFFSIGSFIVDWVLALQGLFGSDNIIATNISKYSEYAVTEGIRNWRGFTFKVFPLVILCFLTIPSSEKDESYRFYYNILLIATILYCFLSHVGFGFRMVFGQMIIQTLVIPFAYNSGNPNRKLALKLYVLGCIFYYIFYLTMVMNSNNYGAIVPYQFYWE